MTFRLLITILVVPFVAFAGCAPQETSPATAPGVPSASVFPADDLGRNVVKKVARRVACIGPGATEIVYALGAGDRLVGRDEYSDFPAQAKKVAVVGDFKGPFLESLIAAKPDLLIVQGESYTRASLENWQKKSGVAIAAINANNIKELEADIQKIGAWLDVRKTIAIPFVPSSVPARRVFLEVSRAPLMTAGDDTLVGDAMKYASLKNVAGEIIGYKPYNLESLIAKNPDVYIVTSKEKPAVVLQQLRNQAGLKNLECIRRGRVAVVDPDLFLRPSPRLKEGIAQLRQTVSNVPK